MTKEFLYDFIHQHQLAVISTINANSKPESALIGIAVTENLEIIFDTVSTSRKYSNLLQNPNVSLVIGWDNEATVQYEGEAILLNNADAEKYRNIYFNTFPDGRQRAETWPDLVHFKVSPRWIRYSNFNDPAIVEEWNF